MMSHQNSQQTITQTVTQTNQYQGTSAPTLNFFPVFGDDDEEMDDTKSQIHLDTTNSNEHLPMSNYQQDHVVTPNYLKSHEQHIPHLNEQPSISNYQPQQTHIQTSTYQQNQFLIPDSRNQQVSPHLNPLTPEERSFSSSTSFRTIGMGALFCKSRKLPHLRPLPLLPPSKPPLLIPIPGPLPSRFSSDRSLHPTVSNAEPCNQAIVENQMTGILVKSAVQINI